MQKGECKSTYINKRLAESSANGRIVAHLSVLDKHGKQTGTRIPVPTGISLVGAAAASVGVHLDMLGVSGLHALIEVSPDGVEHFVEDLDSTNGSCIGTTQYPLFPKKMYQLAHGKRVSFGPVNCVYEITEPERALGGVEECVVEDPPAAAVMHQSTCPDGTGISTSPVKLLDFTNLSRDSTKKDIYTEPSYRDQPNGIPDSFQFSPEAPQSPPLFDDVSNVQDGMTVVEACTDGASVSASPIVIQTCNDVSGGGGVGDGIVGVKEDEGVKGDESACTVSQDLDPLCAPHDPPKFTEKAQTKRKRGTNPARASPQTSQHDVHSSDVQAMKPMRSRRGQKAAAYTNKPDVELGTSQSTVPNTDTTEGVQEKETKKFKRAPKRQLAVEVSPRNAEKENGGHAVRIMFTGLSVPDTQRCMEIVEYLDGTIVDTWTECTHLVTDKVRRTTKFLCALAGGRYILDLKWLDVSRKEGYFVDESRYMLKDTQSEKTYKFSLRKSLAHARSDTYVPVFRGMRVYATQNVVPTSEVLSEILGASGGELVHDAGKVDETTIVIGTHKDAQECRKMLQRGYKVYTSEVVLLGVLRQLLELDTEFYLDLSDVKVSPSKPGRGKQ